MPKFVVEQNLLGLLVQDQIFGQPNPFKVAIEFLDKTEGRWDRDNTPEAAGITTILADSWCSLPPSGRRWYASKYFEEAFLTPAEIAQAYGLFQATGLWGELIDYFAWVFIPTDELDSPTPAYLPNSLNEEGEQMTWAEWRVAGRGGNVDQTPRTVEGGYTIPLTPTNTHPVGGGILAQLVGDGYTLYTNANLPAVWQPPVEQPADEPTEEQPE